MTHTPAQHILAGALKRKNFDVDNMSMGKLIKRVKLGDRNGDLLKGGRPALSFSTSQKFTCARRPRCAPCGVGRPAVTTHCSAVATPRNQR